MAGVFCGRVLVRRRIAILCGDRLPSAAPVKIKKAANWSYSLSHSGSSPMSGFLPALSLAASAGYSSAIRHSSLAASLVLAGRALRANRGKFGRVPVSSDLSRPLLGSHYKFVTEATLFELDTHKDPTFSDLYLIHQQGWQGAAEHVSHPERIAWKSMCATDEGREKGERWCKRAIWGNTLPTIKHVWKSVDKLTSDAFVNMWRQRVDLFYSRYSQAVSGK